MRNYTLLKLDFEDFIVFDVKKHLQRNFLFLNKKQRSTLNHKKEVVFNLVNQSFSANSKRYHVSHPTQRRRFKQLIEDKVFDFSKEKQENTPFVLGIDEVSLSGKEMLTTVGNIT